MNDGGNILETIILKNKGLKELCLVDCNITENFFGYNFTFKLG